MSDPAPLKATAPGTGVGMWSCRLLGHDVSFTSNGPVMTWECRRGCGHGGMKEYASPADAKRYATAFDKRTNDDVGRRAPLIGLLPLRLWRRVRTRSTRSNRSA